MKGVEVRVVCITRISGPLRSLTTVKRPVGSVGVRVSVGMGFLSDTLCPVVTHGWTCVPVGPKPVTRVRDLSVRVRQGQVRNRKVLMGDKQSLEARTVTRTTTTTLPPKIQRRVTSYSILLVVRGFFLKSLNGIKTRRSSI